MGFSPIARPLPDPTRLRADGGDFQSGDIEFTSGVGIALRVPDAGGFVIDGPTTDNIAPSGLFVPSAATWPATTLAMPQGASVLRIVEALIAGTTPGAADADNCYRVDLVGAISGSAQLPMPTDTRTHLFDQATPVRVGGFERTSGDSDENHVVCITPITPTATLTVTGISMQAKGAGSDAFVSKRYVIVNESRTEYIAVTDYESAVVDGFHFIALNDGSVELEQGVSYWVGFESDPAGGRDDWRYVASNRSNDYVEGQLTVDGNMLVRPSGDQYDALHESLLQAASAPDFYLHGAAAGVTIAGALTIALTEVGAAPAIPTDINLRMQWSAEQ